MYLLFYFITLFHWGHWVVLCHLHWVTSFSGRDEFPCRLITIGQGSCLILCPHYHILHCKSSLLVVSIYPYKWLHLWYRGIYAPPPPPHPQPDPGHFLVNAEGYDLVFLSSFFLFYREKEDRAMPKYPGRHNPANFGKYGHCYCICENPGQAPCPSRVPHPDAKKPKWWQQRGEAAQWCTS